MTEKTDEPKKAGQPTKYKEEYNDLAYKICKETGATDKQLAEILSVTETTINNWKNDHPKFFESLIRGKDIFTVSSCENNIIKRGNGYEYQEKEFKRTKITAEDGSITYEMVLFRVFSRHMPADVRANQYLMQNRNPNRWKNTKFIVPGDIENDSIVEAMKTAGETLKGRFVKKPE